MFSALSLCGSLVAGRQARALYESSEPADASSATDTQQSPVSPFGVPDADGDVDGDANSLEKIQPLRPDHDTLLVSAHGSLAMPRPEASATRRAAEPTPATTAAAAATAVLAPLPIKGFEPGSPRPLLSGKLLSMFDVNTARAIKVMPFDQNGVPDADAFAKIRAFMRCRRSGHEMDMDPRLIAVLSRISQHFGDATLQVISGHRKPDGKATRETSQHAFGTAADIRVPGVSIETVKAAAQGLGAKGIGLYTKSQFVHVDVRERAYSWRERGEEAGADLPTDLPEISAARPVEEASAL